MKNFLIITNRTKDPDGVVTGEIVSYLKEHGAVCVTDASAAMTGEGYTQAERVPQDTECVIVLGGDGTMLQAAIDLIDRDIPLVGINLGTLGFLAEINRNDIREALNSLLADRYEIEKRMMLRGEVCLRKRGTEAFEALNDIVITRKGSMRINYFNIFVNGKHLHRYHADGILVATPTGSTGYSLSAGGPIVSPSARLMVLTPICPHSMQNRSIVFSAEDEIIIEMETRGDEDTVPQIEVIFDGGHQIVLEPGDQVRISQSDKTTGIIKLRKESFLEILNKKLGES